MVSGEGSPRAIYATPRTGEIALRASMDGDLPTRAAPVVRYVRGDGGIEIETDPVAAGGSMNLNAAHIHLLVNHVPVFGTIFAALLIAWGLLRKSEEVLRLGLGVGGVGATRTWVGRAT